MSSVTLHIIAAPNSDNSELLEEIATPNSDNSELLEEIAKTCIQDYDLPVERVYAEPVGRERNETIEILKLVIPAATTLWQIYQYIQSLRPTATITIRHGNNVIVRTERGAEAIRLLKLQIERGLSDNYTIEIHE